MKLFKLEFGAMLGYAAAESMEEMFERRAEVNENFHYLPVAIEEITLNGHEIIVSPIVVEGVHEEDIAPLTTIDDEFESMEKPALVEFLTANNVEHKGNWGEKRLRETARAFVERTE